MARLLQVLLALSALPLYAHAHMEMYSPYPINSQYDPAVPIPLKDYSYTDPLFADGSNFPCKGYQTENTSYTIKANYTAGGTYNMSLIGGIDHDGGSCQVSLSYDNGATFYVIKSMIGGCPTSTEFSFDFTIPSFVPAGSDVLLAWTWFNLIGNREMYMSCARVAIASSPGSHRRTEAMRRQVTLDSLPPLFVCNVNNGCTSIEYVNVEFPDPGDDVVYGEDVITASSGIGYTGGPTATATAVASFTTTTFPTNTVGPSYNGSSLTTSTTIITLSPTSTVVFTLTPSSATSTSDPTTAESATTTVTLSGSADPTSGSASIVAASSNAASTLTTVSADPPNTAAAASSSGSFDAFSSLSSFQASELSALSASEASAAAASSASTSSLLLTTITVTVTPTASPGSSASSSSATATSTDPPISTSSTTSASSSTATASPMATTTTITITASTLDPASLAAASSIINSEFSSLSAERASELSSFLATASASATFFASEGNTVTTTETFTLPFTTLTTLLTIAFPTALSGRPCFRGGFGGFGGFGCDDGNNGGQPGPFNGGVPRTFIA